MADLQINHQDAIEYWQNVDADVNGMLGGYPNVSKVDLQGSRSFLAKLGIGRGQGLRRVNRAVDCGAGIGRITEGILSSIADRVDIVEPVVKFTDTLEAKPGIGMIFSTGLEEWKIPTAYQYDLIWAQWCLGHLTSAQLVIYLRQCVKTLSKGGYIIVKENLTSTGSDVFHDDDNSVTRSDEHYRELFQEAGLTIVRTELQHGLPKALFKIPASEGVSINYWSECQLIMKLYIITFTSTLFLYHRRQAVDDSTHR